MGTRDPKHKAVDCHGALQLSRCSEAHMELPGPPLRNWSLELLESSLDYVVWVERVHLPPLVSLSVLDIILGRLALPQEIIALIWRAAWDWESFDHATLDESDLRLVMDQTNASLWECAESLQNNRGDVINAIMLM